MHAQFKRAKAKPETPEMQLIADVSNAIRGNGTDKATIRRLSEKLQLKTMNDMKKESVALHEMVISDGGDPGEYLEEMSTLLMKLKDFVVQENPDNDIPENEKTLVKHRSPIIPDDFRCPISLELMKDPVIVSTGQVSFLI